MFVKKQQSNQIFINEDYDVLSGFKRKCSFVKFQRKFYNNEILTGKEDCYFPINYEQMLI